MDTHGETIDLDDGLSLIDVRGGSFDSLLLVDGHPIALNWSDCQGSVGQYMARAGVTDCEDELRHLRHVLDGNLLADTPVSSQVYAFLQLFVPARYRLQYYENCQDCDYIQFDASWSHSRAHDSFYPFGHVLVFTQPVDTLNHDRVHYYLARIGDGHRPIALSATVDEGWCEFVIDGHHKLQAYRMAKAAPAFISVCRLDAPRLSAGAFNDCIGGAHPMASHYRKVKTEHGS